MESLEYEKSYPRPYPLLLIPFTNEIPSITNYETSLIGLTIYRHLHAFVNCIVFFLSFYLLYDVAIIIRVSFFYFPLFDQFTSIPQNQNVYHVYRILEENIPFSALCDINIKFAYPNLYHTRTFGLGVVFCCR